MILAAGLGTRLRPLTADHPKALLDVGGLTLLERAVQRLALAGCDNIVVNVHHHADRIVDHVARRGDLSTDRGGASYRWHGSRITFSREAEAPLDTGGGILNAARLFRPGHAILVHNVDVVSDIDLNRLVAAHRAAGPIATLAVSRREASRYLVFDDEGLCGRVDLRTGAEERVRPSGSGEWRAGFTGIHVLSDRLPALVEETGAFSIVATYLGLAAAGQRILPHDVTGARWIDVGTPERLEAARKEWSARAG
jgi:NDP-sugar pyrophosphorylase family protein